MDEEMEFEVSMPLGGTPKDNAGFEKTPLPRNTQENRTGANIPNTPFFSIAPTDDVQRKAKEEAQRREMEDARRRAMEDMQRREREDTLLRKAKEDALHWQREEAKRRAMEDAQRKERENAQRLAREDALRREKEDAQRKAMEEAQRRAQEEARHREKEETLQRELEALRREKEMALHREKEALSRTKDAEQGKNDDNANTPSSGNTSSTQTDDVYTALTKLVPQRKSGGDSKVPADEAAAFSLVEFALLTEEVLRKKKMGEMIPPPHKAHSSSSLSLVEFVLILWKGKYIIAICAILATVAGYMHARRLPDVFTSSSNFVMNTSSNIESFSRMNSPFGGSGKADPTDYLDKILQDGAFLATLYDRPWDHNGDLLSLEDILGIVRDTSANSNEYAYQMQKYNRIRYRGMITTWKDQKNGVVTLSTNAPAPQLAYDLNLHTLEYIGNFLRSSIQSRAKEKRIFIENRMREARRELDIAEGTLARFRERNMNTTSPTILREEARMLRQVNVNQEIYTQLLKQLDIAKLEELDNVELIQIVKNPEMSYQRSSPNVRNIVMMAFAIGLFVGLVLTLVVHQFQEYRKHMKLQAGMAS